MSGQSKFKAGTFFHHIREAAGERGETLADTIAWTMDLGYSAAELDADDLDGTDALLQKGMQVSSIYRNYPWRESIDVRMMEDHIRLAEKFKTTRIMAIPGLFSGTADKERELENMHEGMRQLEALAKENGLTLTIEDYDNTMSPIATMGGMNTFLEEIPDLKVTLDTGNFIFSEEDILTALQMFLPKVAHVHLKDRLWSRTGAGDILESVGGRKLYPCAVCDGDIPIREVMRGLADSGYDGYVVAEFFGSRSYAEHIEKSAINFRKEGWIV